jgi:hypothetical protein
MLAGRRVLEAAPTHDQTSAFWTRCRAAVGELVSAGVCYQNLSERVLEMPNGGRIRAKTAHDANTLRGDYADLLILDEFSLMDPTAWTEVGAPMLLDNNGDALFIFTPKGNAGIAREHYERAQKDTTGRWEAWHFTSHDNPALSTDALAEITQDMTERAYRQEILAQWLDDVPGALWSMALLDGCHVATHPDLSRVVVAVDPAVTSGEDADETGIIVAGNGIDANGYVLADRSCRLSPDGWARRAVAAYHEFDADRIVAESNNGGEMVKLTIQTVDPRVPVTLVHASRGKRTRAEPVTALYEQHRIKHVGTFSELESQMMTWTPDSGTSPDRLDALVWGFTDLMLGGQRWGAV